MRLSRILTTLAFSAALLAVGPPASAEAAPTPPDQCSAAFYQGNPLLGPADLPRVGPVGRIMRGYYRTGALSSSDFLGGFRNPYIDHGNPGWLYPPFSGFALRLDGKVIKHVAKLKRGVRIDRFGGEGGGFLSPEGTLFGGRAIPPTSLESSPPASCNYHDYEVIKAFKVQSGPSAPWFAQPGHCTQYVLDASLVPGAPPPADFNVGWLISRGYLKRLPV